jgi:hypothetical protein
MASMVSQKEFSKKEEIDGPPMRQEKEKECWTKNRRKLEVAHYLATLFAISSLSAKIQKI